MSQKIDSTAYDLKYLSEVMPPPYDVYDQIELVNKVHEFYNDSFSILIAVTALLVGIVGIVVPLLVARKSDADKKSLDELKDKISKMTLDFNETKAEYNTLKNTLARELERMAFEFNETKTQYDLLKNTLTQELEGISKLMDKKNKLLDNRINSKVYHIQAVISHDKNSLIEAFRWIIKSIRSGIFAKDNKSRINFRITQMESWLKKIPAGTQVSLDYSSIDEIIDSLMPLDGNPLEIKSFTDQIKEILLTHSEKLIFK